MLTSLLSVPYRFLGLTGRRSVARGRASASRRVPLMVEWLEQRDVPSITITPATLPNPQVGANYSQALTGSGGTSPYTFKLSGSTTLPAGLSLTNGTISGTPTAGGSFSFTIQATDSSSTPQTGSQHYTVTVSAATIVLSPTKLGSATVGKSYTQTITASGGTASYKLTETGTLPAGVTFKDNGDGTGTLSGKPTAGGSFNFTIQATDSSTGTGPYTKSQSYTLTVNKPNITLGPARLAAAPTGVSFTRTITATGGTAPYTFTFTKNTLPKGVSLEKDPTDTTGTKAIVTGTTSSAGTFSFTISVKDSSTGTGPYSFSRSFSLAINPAKFVFLTQPGSAAMNAALAPFAVELLDQSGKAVTGQVTLRLIPVVTEGAAAFKSGSTTKVTTASNGVATFTNVAITARGRYKLEAFIGSASVFSDVFDIGLDGRHSPGQ
jgi:hypothetical protein